MYTRIGPGEAERTVHCQVSQRSTGRGLYFDVRALEEEEDGFESVAVDFADIWWTRR